MLFFSSKNNLLGRSYRLSPGFGKKRTSLRRGRYERGNRALNTHIDKAWRRFANSRSACPCFASQAS
jgi:hypothetical protein